MPEDTPIVELMKRYAMWKKAVADEVVAQAYFDLLRPMYEQMLRTGNWPWESNHDDTR